MINQPERLQMEGPLLLACNHPNSFLDAILLDILFKKPVWSLARGDVFTKPFTIKLLAKLRILPVYRTSEGVENLETNYTTFESCKNIFRKKGIVQVFSEGKCINEWHLRPLKKGTARLAISAWEDGIDLKVLPVGINYSSFNRFGKNIFLNFGSVITKESILAPDTDGKRNLLFNEQLRKELEKLVFEIDPTNKERKEKLLMIRHHPAVKAVLAIPALAGLLLNAPLFLPARFVTNRLVKDSDHYDSVLVSILVFSYPFYLIMVSSLVFWFTCSYLAFLLFFVFPFTAWAYVQLKRQLDI